MSPKALLFVLSMSFITSGCASMIDGPTQTVSLVPMHDGRITRGATCTASNNKGSWVATGGGTVTVRKSRADLDVRCVDRTTNAVGTGIGPRSTSFRWIAANFFIWDLCTISCLVDFSSGSIYEYPTQVQVQMPNGSQLDSREPEPYGF